MDTRAGGFPNTDSPGGIRHWPSDRVEGQWKPEIDQDEVGVTGNGKVAKKWYDEAEGVVNPLIDEDADGGELYGSEWRQEPEGEWVKVESVMDSGASAPVAPPTMAPKAPIRPSEGSRRGQKYTSASKHKLPNLGEQLLRAVTEDGAETSVLFQIADVSRPLVSVSAICEMGNRVIFGKGGGAVQNLATGRETPFHRKN